MIYFKRFLLFIGIISIILIFVVLNALIMRNLDGNIYSIIAYLALFVALIAFTDVQIDKWLDRGRKRSQDDLDEQLDRLHGLQEQLKKNKGR